MRHPRTLVLSALATLSLLVLWCSRGDERADPVLPVGQPVVDGMASVDDSAPQDPVDGDSREPMGRSESPSEVAGGDPGPRDAERPETRLLAPHLRARILDADGLPLRQVRIDRTFACASSGTKGGATIRSDGQGIVVFRLPPRFGDCAGLTLRFQWTDNHRKQAQSPWLNLPDSWVGTRDLGDVRLVGQNLLLAGRVVNAAGQPVPHAHVLLQWRRQPPEWEDSQWRDRQSIPQGVLATEEGEFAFFQIKNDPLGSLELRVETGGSGYVPRLHIPVTKGDTDVLVVLDEGGRLQGKLLMDLALEPINYLEVVAQQKNNVEWQGAIGVIPLPGSMPEPVAIDFELTGILPGRCDVSFYLNRVLGDPIWVVEDVDVPASGPVDDPRFGEIDLTFLYVLRVDVVDEEGQALAAKLRLRRAGTETWPTYAVMSADPNRPGLVASDPLVDILVSKRGYKDVVIERVKTDQRVVLHRD